MVPVSWELRQRLSAGLPWLTQGLLFWASDMLLNTWEARMGVFANSSNKRVISEHQPKLDAFMASGTSLLRPGWWVILFRNTFTWKITTLVQVKSYTFNICLLKAIHNIKINHVLLFLHKNTKMKGNLKQKI